MQILPHKNYKEFLEYLPRLKDAPKDWQLVDIRIVHEAQETLTVESAADIANDLFKGKEGRLYICNNHEILVVVQWGQEKPSGEIVNAIEKKMPEGCCQIHAQEASSGGIAKLEVLITFKGTAPAPSLELAQKRGGRRENVFLVADDDMYMRLLLKKALASPNSTVWEATEGNAVVAAYKQYVPDILFLDIHMPGMDGTDVLKEIIALDPKAFVVMLSADSSQENVEMTTKSGAKGFLTKPFSKERLQEFVQKCPTVY